MAPYPPHAQNIIPDAIGAVFVGADIDPDHAATMRTPIEAIDEGVEPLIVEAKPIDDGAIWAQSKDAGAGIALLRARRDGAAFDKTKARRKHGVWGFAILVEAGGQTDWVGQIKARQSGFQPCPAIGPRAWAKPKLQPGNSGAMSRLWVDEAKRLRGDVVHEHGSGGGNVRAALACFFRRIDADCFAQRVFNPNVLSWRYGLGILSSNGLKVLIGATYPPPMQHGDVWRAIEALAAARGLTVSGLARAAGLDPTTFNKSKRHAPDGKPRWPSTESVARALQAADANWDEFAALIAGESGAAGRAIPILSMARAGREGVFDESGFPIGAEATVRFPGLGQARLYALEIAGTALEPIYRAGDLLIVQPGAATRRGDRVVVRTRAGEVMAKALGRRNDQMIELIALNPGQATRELASADLDWMARIVWASQ